MKKWVSRIILCILIPAVVIGGATLFREKRYAWLSLAVAVLAMLFCATFSRPWLVAT